MPLPFADATGNDGRITDEFAVEYDGPEPVEKHVTDILEAPLRRTASRTSSSIRSEIST